MKLFENLHQKKIDIEQLVTSVQTKQYNLKKILQIKIQPQHHGINNQSIHSSSGVGTGQQILETESKKPHEETATHIQQIPPPPPVQQNSFPPHGQPLNSANNHYPNDAYQQLQHIFLSTNYNQSNNNEILDNKEEKRTRTAERILDAFERFYINTGRSPLTPIKVKFIPDETNSNYNHNQNLIST
jgi:hypothetical protein